MVYDLPPGADPVLHRAPIGGARDAVSDDEAPSERPPTSSLHIFTYEPPDGETVVIGEWSPAGLGQSPDAAVMHGTDVRETAEFWRAELSAGRLPQRTENVP